MNNNTDFSKDNEIFSILPDELGGGSSTRNKRSSFKTCAMIFGMVGISCLALMVMFTILFKQDLLVINHMIKGLGYSEQGDIDPALREFNQALEINPESVFAYLVYFYRGIVYARTGVVDLAIADFDNAIRLEPTFPFVYTNRAAAHLVKGDLEHAIDDFDKAISLDPDFANSYIGRGVAYFRRIIELGTNAELSRQAAEELRNIALPEETNQSPINADAIAGVWSGSASGGSFTFQITVTIATSCAIGSVCGPLDIPAIPCSGTFTLIGISGATYDFRAGSRQGSCGQAFSDTLILLPDGTLLYVSKGEYGESKGVLQRVK